MAPRRSSGNNASVNQPASQHAARQPTFNQTTPRARQPPVHKFDPANHHRHEIEQRTAAGETCEQIASALRAQGVDITNKTISRRRVEWGLRKRPYSKLLGKKTAVPRPKKASGTKTADTHARKLEIEARTRAGQSAEEIAAALEGLGYVLKKGASTVLRLQTQWCLIPPDPDRARGRKRRAQEVDADGNVVQVQRVRKRDLPKLVREREREANKVQQMQARTLHYPTNCSFGPKKRGAGGGEGVGGVGGEEDGVGMLEDGGEDGVMPGLDSLPPPLPYPSPIDQHLPPPQQQQQHVQSVSVAADVMSVDFLVDLANSTLVAAEHLKASLLAYQARQPVQGSSTGLSPSAEDLATARRKVREAAAVMHDLAVEPRE